MSFDLGIKLRTLLCLLESVCLILEATGILLLRQAIAASYRTRGNMSSIKSPLICRLKNLAVCLLRLSLLFSVIYDNPR
jgi:hypothetical protein